jgi:hypothetical protein
MYWVHETQLQLLELLELRTFMGEWAYIITYRYSSAEAHVNRMYS